MRRISAHLLSTPRGLLPDRVVTLSDEGTITDIAHVGPGAGLDRLAGVEFYPGVLAPGFRNAHCHLELSYLRGAIAPRGGFAEFARGMRSERERCLAERRAEAAVFWDARMWSEGVSRVDDVCNGAESFATKRRSRTSYHSYCELFGLHASPRHAFELCAAARAGGLSASVTPHSTYSLNRAAFAAVAGRDAVVTANGTERLDGMSGEEPPLSIHFMESEQEPDLFRRRGPLRDWYAEQGLAPDFLDYGSPAERLVAQVPRNREVMLVHNCVVTQRDIDIVMEHFTAPVTWVVCPASNRHISGLTPPTALLRRNGLRVAVGTDSLASNDTLSMVAELALMPEVPLAERLAWSAAQTIEVGRAPGLALIEGVDLKTLTLTPAARSRRIV
jgi:cytosine/adenosine deaminase-related metal-dependent hydrolase